LLGHFRAGPRIISSAASGSYSGAQKGVSYPGPHKIPRELTEAIVIRAIIADRKPPHMAPAVLFSVPQSQEETCHRLTQNRASVG